MASCPQDDPPPSALGRLRLKWTATIKWIRQHTSWLTIADVIAIMITVAAAPFWWCLVSVSILILLGVGSLWTRFPAVAQFPRLSRSLWASLVVVLCAAILWTPIRTKYAEEYPARSAVYVVPEVWSPSPVARWFMIIRHCGPAPLYHVAIDFGDADRRRKMAGRPPIDPQEFATSGMSLQFPEIDPTENGPMFAWTPLSPDREDYIIRIVSRDAIVDESLQIQRAGENWHYRITVSDVTKSQAVKILNCRDPGFTAPSTDTQLPACFPHYVAGAHRDSCD